MWFTDHPDRTAGQVTLAIAAVSTLASLATNSCVQLNHCIRFVSFKILLLPTLGICSMMVVELGVREGKGSEGELFS